MPLLLESAQSESLEKLIAICGHIGFRACGYDLGDRPAYACVYRRRQNGVDVARIRTTEYDRHCRDLSAIVDLVSHGYIEVGSCRNQRVEVGHHTVLPDKTVGPEEVGVKGASHHLALAVAAAG